MSEFSEYNLFEMLTNLVSGGSPALQKTVQVTINIVDVNDNPPIISPSTYVAGVKENLPPGQSVLRVRTDDEFKPVTYGSALIVKQILQRL